MHATSNVRNMVGGDMVARPSRSPWEIWRNKISGSKGCRRIILYLGKGGVGKTTVSAATAARSAALGKRTLVVSTDLAHSLADCLNTPLTSEPKQLAANLWAQEVNVLDEMRRGWSKVQDA